MSAIVEMLLIAAAYEMMSHGDVSTYDIGAVFINVWWNELRN